jgi:hypothetical protein
VDYSSCRQTPSWVHLDGLRFHIWRSVHGGLEKCCETCRTGQSDLAMMGYALRLQWEWLRRTEPDHIWTALPSDQDRILQAMFNASVTVQIGNGLQGKFWLDRWLHGEAIESSCPDLVLAVLKRVRKLRTVHQVLQNN